MFSNLGIVKDTETTKNTELMLLKDKLTITRRAMCFNSKTSDYSLK